MAERRYERVLEYVRTTPWALEPSVLSTLVDVMRMRASGQKFDEVELQERIGNGRPPRPTTAGSIAVIPIVGVLMPKASLFSEVSGASSLETIQAQLRAALADPDVKAILLDLDSPGGSVELVPETASMIRAGRSRKPIVAAVNTLAASAAYHLASQASSIAVTPSGMVGSIGVFAVHDDFSEARAKAGITTTVVSSSVEKVEQLPLHPLSDEARRDMQAKVDSFAARFVDDVGRGRHVSAGKVQREFGGGRLLLADQAVRVGAADSVLDFAGVLDQLSAGPRRSPAATELDRTRRLLAQLR